MGETLFRVVNGVRVPLSDEEAAAVRAEWASNAAAPAPALRRLVSSLTFLERFTQEERIRIRRAARQNEVLEDWLDMLRAAQEVDLDEPRTRMGLAAMVNAALLTPQRRDEILA